MNLNLSQYFEKAAHSLFLVIKRNFQGRFWKVYCTILCVALSILTAFPDYDLVFNQLSEEPFLTIKTQITDPFHPQIFKSNWGYEEHLSMRITVPIIAHILHLDIAGCYILMGILGFLFFYLVTNEIFKITQDRVCSILLSLAVALCFPGKSFFNDYNGFFDSYGYFFLVLAIVSRNPFVIFFSLLAASFINERAYIASSFVLLYHISHFDSISEMFSGFRKKQTMAILAIWITYPILRYFLNAKFGLDTGTHGFGISIMLWNLQMYPIGLFFGLEFLWALIILMAICLYLRKSFLFLVCILISLGVYLFTTALVTDVTRSIAFIFPCIFLALKVIYQANDLSFLRRFLLLIVALNLLLPTYIVSHEIYQFENIILRLGRWVI